MTVLISSNTKKHLTLHSGKKVQVCGHFFFSLFVRRYWLVSIGCLCTFTFTTLTVWWQLEPNPMWTHGNLYLLFFYVKKNFQSKYQNSFSYKHFYYFVTEFHLMNDKEFEPLKEMTQRICTDLLQTSSSSGLASSKHSQAATSASAASKSTLPAFVEERYAYANMIGISVLPTLFLWKLLIFFANRHFVWAKCPYM